MLDSDIKENFKSIRTTNNKYWDSLDSIEKGKGYKQFKRWEWFWTPRTYPSGMMPDINNYYQFDRKSKKNSNKQLNSNWTFIGPEKSNGGIAGLGRVNVIKTAPNIENIFWAGAASGGLWKSTDAGKSWSTNTDDFSSLGISDLVIQPNNSKIMYLATGDADAASTFSTGVLKSTNSGASWHETGLKFKTSQLKRIYKLVMHPTNFNILYAAGNNGIDKTTNGGQNWVNILQGKFFDIELKPNDPNTIYAVGTEFYQSTNGGQYWEQMTNGWPSINVTRAAISVTSMAPNNVYAIISNERYGFGGFFLSTNSGYAWQNRSNSPNILGWSTTGSDAGGQGWYDLCIAASPIDPNIVYIGGINIWRTDDAGLSWELETNWYSTGKVSTVHADHHDLWFIPNNPTLFSANDGGVYRKRFNNNWEWLGNGLGITQFYSLGCSAADSSMILGGCQDNGTKLKTSSGFDDIRSGDGTTSRIDYSDDNILYASLPFGGFLRSTDKGVNFRTVKPIGSRGNWITPLLLNPINPSSLIAAFEDVYKSTRRGVAWIKISDFALPDEESLTFLGISKSDTNIIYTGQGIGILKKTTDGGGTWRDFVRPADLWISSLIVNPYNPAIIYITFSGYEEGKKVYRSNDGGQSWQNMTKNLPNVPFNTIIYEEDTPNRIYAGSDIGVFYIDDTKDEWVEFSDGLPNAVVSELSIQYQSGMIRAATYGRGLWQSQLAPTTLNPRIIGDTIVCSNKEITYSTISFPGITNIWSVEGGRIADSSNSDTIKVIWNPEDFGSIKLLQSIRTGTIKDSVINKILITEFETPEIIGPDTVCNHANMLYFSSSDKYRIKWQVQGGQILGSDTSTQINIYWSSDSSASVSLIWASNDGLCSDTTTKHVSLTKIKKPIIEGDSIVCSIHETVYTSNFDNALIPFWTVEGGNIISNNGDNIKIKWGTVEKGTIILKLLNQNNGCSDSTHYIVQIDQIPECDITGDFQNCIRKEIVFSTSEDSSYKYTWAVSGGYISGADSSNIVSVVWTQRDFNSISLTKSLRSSDCSSDTTVIVEVLENPQASISGINSICENQSADYRATNVNNNNFKWEVSGGIITSSPDDTLITVNWRENGLGIVKLILTNPLSSCRDSAIYSVNINKLPEAGILGMTDVCEECTEEYYTDNNVNKNKWFVTGGKILTSDESDTISIKWGAAGIGTIKLVQTSSTSLCTDSTDMQINISNDLIQGINGNSESCSKHIEFYTTTSSSEFTNKWSVENGNIIGEDNMNSVQIKWNNLTKGKVKLSQTNITTQTEELFELVVDINQRPPRPEISLDGSALRSNVPSGNQWYYENQKIAGETKQILYPSLEGIYTLNVKDTNNCESEFSDSYEYLFNSVSEQNQHQLIIYPNPAQDEIFIQGDIVQSNNLFIRIINIYGEDCKFSQSNVTNGVLRINMTCQSGYYILLLTSSKKTVSQSFIIKK